MSKLYDLLQSIISKVKANEKSLESVPKTINGVGPDENGNIQIEVQSASDVLKVMFGIFIDLDYTEYAWCNKTYEEIFEYYHAGKTIEAGCWKYGQYHHIELSFDDSENLFEFTDPETSNLYWNFTSENRIGSYLDRGEIPL